MIRKIRYFFWKNKKQLIEACGFLALLAIIMAAAAVEYVTTVAPISGMNNAGNLFLKKYYLIIVLLMFVGASCMFYICSKFKDRIEYVFILFMITFGLMYMIVLPAFSAPDEPAHYATSYRLANDILGVDGDDNPDYVFVRNSDIADDMKPIIDMESYRYVYETTFDKNNDTEMGKLYMSGKVLTDTPLVSHLPQALGIIFGRLFKMSYSGMVMFARLLCLTFYTVAVFFAIKITPIGKNVFFIVSVFPVMLQEITSLGYDVIVNGLAFLLTAQVLKILYGKTKVTVAQFVGCLVTAIIMAPCKMVYFPITFMLILAKKQRFEKKWMMYASRFAIPAAAMISALGYNMTKVAGSSGAGNYIEWAGQEGYTLGDIIGNPIQTLGVVLLTFHNYFDHYLGTMIGSEMSWLDIPIPNYIIFGFLAITVLSMFEKNKVFIRTSHKVWATILFIGMCGMIWLSLWLGWTPKGYMAILGIQGRYFLPALPLLLSMLHIYKKDQKTDFTNIIVYSAFALNWLVVLRCFDNVLHRLLVA